MNTENTAVVEETEVTEFHPGRGRKPMNKYEARRIRNGKTRKDHESGAWKQRLINLEERAAWINETRPKNYASEASVPKMPKAHGLGNGAKRFKIKPARRAKG